MSKRRQLAGRFAAAAVALALTSSGRSFATDNPTTEDPSALAAAGRFEEAYARLLDEGKTKDPTALRELSRAVLGRAIRSPFEYERWAGLRAGRLLDDPSLAAPARERLDSGRYEQSLAIEILARSDPEGSRDAFVAALDSPHRAVRMRALRALRPRPETSLVPRLVMLATEDGDPDVRVLAIRTLADWQARDSVPSLRATLDDPVKAVQQETVRALVALGDPDIAATVRRRIAEAGPESRAAALRLAALVPRTELLDDVGAYLGDPEPEVRVAAAAAVLSILRPAAGGQ